MGGGGGVHKRSQSALRLNGCYIISFIWRALVLHLNETLLAHKGKEGLHNKAQWCLKVNAGVYVDKAWGPVYIFANVPR